MSKHTNKTAKNTNMPSDPIMYSLKYESMSKVIDNVPPVFRIKNTYMMSCTQRTTIMSTTFSTEA